MKDHRRSNRSSHVEQVCVLVLGLAVAVVGLRGDAAEPAKPEFLISTFDLGAVDQVRANDSELAKELTAQGWCTAKPKEKAAGSWSAVPAGVEPDRWVSIVTVGFGHRAEAYAFQFSGPTHTAKLLAHVSHRKRPAAGGERWFSPFGNLLDAFRIGHATAQKPPLPSLQIEVVLTNPKGAGNGGADEALTLAPDKVFPPMQAIVTADP
ncbi:MAG: hypothetical protein K8U57_14450 [Planctomycetes bacterium]|nr:hypothetical protein [Planctomycetota bacterium]